MLVTCSIRSEKWGRFCLNVLHFPVPFGTKGHFYLQSEFKKRLKDYTCQEVGIDRESGITCR